MINSSNSTKRLILKVLGEKFPSTLSQIHMVIKTKKNISYQAVHKTIKELIDENIVEKIEKQYFLNKKWIKEQTETFSQVYSNYFNTAYNPNQQNKSSNIQVFRFLSAKEVLDFIIDAHVKNFFNQEESNKIYISVKRMLPFIPQSMIHFLKKLLKENEIYILCKNNTLADRWVAKIYRSMGINVITGAYIPHYNSVCIGNCVLQYYFFFNESIRKKLYDFSNKFKIKSSINLIKMTSDILYKQTEIFVIVNRHPILVEDMKETISEAFK